MQAYSELQKKMNSLAIKNPKVNKSFHRQKYIYENTKDKESQKYLKAWHSKIQSLVKGKFKKNLKSISSKREKAISKTSKKNILYDLTIIVETIINSDGSIRKIVIHKPSIIEEYNQLILELIEAAAPFEPFPMSFRKHIDTIHIKRKWTYY